MRGLIFDLDGVITDTAEFHFLAWQKLAQEEGITFTREDNDALRGIERRRSLELLLKGQVRPESEMQAMMKRKNDYYLQLIDGITPDDLLIGAGEFLRDARAEGFRIGLGSASKNARSVLERLQIADLFDVIGDGYSVVHAKPAPDLFIWVAGGLGLNPADCVVFEDAESGIDAALQGGFNTVGIGTPERLTKAHRVVEGLHQLRPSEFA
jgi:beta-phosphoglucomutase